VGISVVFDFIFSIPRWKRRNYFLTNFLSAIRGGLAGTSGHPFPDLVVRNGSFPDRAKGDFHEECLGMLVGQAHYGRADGERAQGVPLLLREVHGPGYRLDVGTEFLREGQCGIGVGEGYL